MSDDIDLDRLERLNRLREGGALTQEEFDQQKAVIIGKERPTASPIPMVVFVGVALTLAVIAILAFMWLGNTEQIARPAPSPAVAKAEASARPDVPAQAAEVDAEPPGESQDELLRFATSNEVIGLNPEYLDRRLGVPRESGRGYRIFEIGGCTIYYVGEPTKIEGFSVEVTSSCRPVIQGRRISPDTRFGQLKRMQNWGDYFASCLSSCGNATDPVLDLRYRGSRATQFIGVSYSSNYQDAVPALDLWQQSIRRELGLGERDWPDDSSAFNCRSSPPSEVSALMQRLRVRSVAVGLNYGDGC